MGPPPHVSIDPGESLKLSLSYAVGRFVPGLVLILFVLLMGLPGLTLERFLSFWTYVMISGQLTEPHATVAPALLTLLGCCRSVLPHSGPCPCLPCCRSWILDCCPLWGSPVLATTWHLQIALGSRKLLVRTCSTAWAGSTLQNF